MASSTISEKKFRFLSLLGHGGFAKVYLCEKKFGANKRHYYAIKQIDAIEKYTIERAENECTILKKVSRICPFICELFDSYLWNSKYHMVMKFNGGGDLNFNVKQRGPFNAKEARFLIGQLTIAIDSIHSLNYVFRDIKPENVMLDSNGNIVLVDFGLAKKQSKNKSEKLEYVGTPGYMAPEILNNEPVGDFECAIDWWAMGVTLSYIMTGTSLFANPGDKDKTITTRIYMQEPLVDNIQNEDAKNLILALLDINRTKRINGEGIRKHPFFAMINWEDLKNKKIPAPFKPKMENEFDTSNFSHIFTNQRIMHRQVAPMMQDSRIELKPENASAVVVKIRQKSESDTKEPAAETPSKSELSREDATKCIVTALAKRKRGHPSAPEEEKICKFPKCKYIARRPSDLKNHMRAVHSRKWFKCDKCTKKFKWGNSLIKHKKKEGH